jgi:SAM-dependent methyltransferase
MTGGRTVRDPNKEATRRHWDRVAASYTGHKEANRLYFDTLKALFRASLPEAREWRLLEVGCGNGDVLRSLQPRAGLGLDISEEMVGIARARHSDCPGLEFQVGDAENLPEGPLYEAVILPDVLEHVPDWRRVLSQAARRVSPGGRLVITTPNPLWAPALYLLEKLRLKTPEGPHRFVGLPAIRRQLQRLGLTPLSCGNFLLIPKELGRLSAWANSALARLPGLAGLGLIQLAVAVRPCESRGGS